MTFLEQFIFHNYKIINLFSFFTVQDSTLNHIDSDLFLYVQFSSAVINFTVIILMLLIIVNFLFNFFFKNITKIMNILRFVNLFSLSFIITLLIIKFYFSLKLEQTLGPYLYDVRYNFFKDYSNLFYFEHFIVFSSSFSDAILILSFITGLICLELLGLKNLFKTINNISLFYIFNFFVVLMVSTNNILIMFISFEFIFLPTMYFVYQLGYSKKIEKSNEILFY